MSLGLTFAQLRDARRHLQGRAHADVTFLALGEEPERVLRSIIDQPGLTGREIAKTRSRPASRGPGCPRRTPSSWRGGWRSRRGSSRGAPR
jgi:hypothetical protein